MKHLMFIGILSIMFSAAIGQQTAAHYNLGKNGLAIEGKDPVAYFLQNKAVTGKASLGVQHGGALYYFSSAENKTLFIANPSKYVPQYGGWCAYAMGSDGTKVEIDPDTFTILDGKLYLFYNKFFNNTLKSWKKDEANLKLKADKNWKKITQ